MIKYVLGKTISDKSVFLQIEWIPLQKKKNDRFASVCLPLLWAQENVGRVWHPGFWESHPSWFWTLTMVYGSRPHAAPWWSKGVTVAA